MPFSYQAGGFAASAPDYGSDFLSALQTGNQMANQNAQLGLQGRAADRADQELILNQNADQRAGTQLGLSQNADARAAQELSMRQQSFNEEQAQYNDPGQVAARNLLNANAMTDQQLKQDAFAATTSSSILQNQQTSAGLNLLPHVQADVANRLSNMSPTDLVNAQPPPDIAANPTARDAWNGAKTGLLQTQNAKDVSSFHAAQQTDFTQKYTNLIDPTDSASVRALGDPMNPNAAMIDTVNQLTAKQNAAILDAKAQRDNQRYQIMAGARVGMAQNRIDASSANDIIGGYNKMIAGGGKPTADQTTAYNNAFQSLSNNFSKNVIGSALSNPQETSPEDSDFAQFLANDISNGAGANPATAQPIAQPTLVPAGTPNAAPLPVANTTSAINQTNLTKARAAISAGADPVKVRARLKQLGTNPDLL